MSKQNKLTTQSYETELMNLKFKENIKKVNLIFFSSFTQKTINDKMTYTKMILSNFKKK